MTVPAHLPPDASRRLPGPIHCVDKMPSSMVTAPHPLQRHSRSSSLLAANTCTLCRCVRHNSFRNITEAQLRQHLGAASLSSLHFDFQICIDDETAEHLGGAAAAASGGIWPLEPRVTNHRAAGIRALVLRGCRQLVRYSHSLNVTNTHFMAAGVPSHRTAGVGALAL